jgi:hypothetical protein
MVELAVAKGKKLPLLLLLLLLLMWLLPALPFAPVVLVEDKEEEFAKRGDGERKDEEVGKLRSEEVDGKEDDEEDDDVMGVVVVDGFIVCV